MSKPNLFNWATSELSQDAFICWLLEWANPEYRNSELHDLAIKLIRILTDSALEIQDLEIRRQYKNIDILVIINKETGLLIEDKIHSKEHGEQLSNYAELLNDEVDRTKLHLVYFKTGDQSNYESVVKKGYSVFNRADFLDLLQKGLKNGIDNDIFVDFYNHLAQMERAVQSYKSLPIDTWHWNSWKGFYLELQKLLGTGEWDYVPQKNGGFLGFWWHWKYKELNGTGYDYYLQLEHQKFCFKLIPYNRDMARKIRDHHRKQLYERAAEHNIEIYQNGRIGNYMTVAALSSDIRIADENGLVDMPRTVAEIKRIEKMIDSV